MNSKIIDKACDKLLSLLSKLSPTRQEQEMEEMYWEINQTNLMFSQITTDSPMAFCLDLSEALKATEESQKVMLMPKYIAMQKEPMQLLVSMLP